MPAPLETDISLPPGGVYQLAILLERKVIIAAGKLGSHTFVPGMYIYTGSAKRALPSRVKRHLSRQKSLRWHIDYFLANKSAKILKIAIYRWRGGAECRWNRDARKRNGGEIATPGFGASDCRERCGAHLQYLPHTSSAEIQWHSSATVFSPTLLS